MNPYDNKAKTKKQLIKNTGAVKGKLIAKNTLDYITADGTRKIRLHETDVLTFRHDGTIEYNTDGYRTPTTKRRINDYQSRIEVYQKSGLWYWNATAAGGWRKTHVFFDGMIIDAAGHCINPEAGKQEADEKKHLVKLIREYCRDFRALEKLPAPEDAAGDCFYCQMRTEDGTAAGDAFGDTSHLLSHLEEKYFMFSLTWNALIDSGRTESQAAFMYRADIRDLITRALADYFKKRFGIAR